MKRTIIFMTSGKGATGRDWYMLKFSCQLHNGVLYKEQVEFVTENVYSALKVGDQLEIR